MACENKAVWEIWYYYVGEVDTSERQVLHIHMISKGDINIL